MPDILTPQQRHANMAAIHGKNTKPEAIVRGAYVLTVQHDTRYEDALFRYLVHMLVESLSCYAKQLTQRTHLVGACLLCQE